MATPRNETPRAARSRNEPGRAPASTPSGTPITIATTMAEPVRMSVLGVRDSSSCATEVCVRYDVPRLPRSSWPRNRAYCSHTGWFSPSWFVRLAICCGVACEPYRITFAGLPGTRWIRMNATKVIPIITGTAAASRRAMKAHMSGQSRRVEGDVAVERGVQAGDPRRHGERVVDVPQREVDGVLHQRRADLLVEGVPGRRVGGAVRLGDHRVQGRVVVVRPVEPGLDGIRVRPDVEQVGVGAVVAERPEVVHAGVVGRLRGGERLNRGGRREPDLVQLGHHELGRRLQAGVGEQDDVERELLAVLGAD